MKPSVVTAIILIIACPHISCEKGRLTWTLSQRHGDSTVNHENNDIAAQNPKPSSSLRRSNQQQEIQISFHILSLFNLCSFGFRSVGTLTSIIVGTLKLLGPLIVSRRILVTVFQVLSDYFTGRYFRKTYTRLERIYLRYYETPALIRSTARTISQICILNILRYLMGLLVDISKHPCKICRYTAEEALPCNVSYSCSLLWLLSVLGAGEAFIAAVARWGGPLRIQQETASIAEDIRRGIFYTSKELIRNPDAWFQRNFGPNGSVNNIIYRTPQEKPFVPPRPIYFPITWIPLNMIQLLVVAFVMSREPLYGDGHKIMFRYLVVRSFQDEWRRVFINERRIGLGIILIFCYICSVLYTVLATVSVDIKLSAWLIPNLLAGLVTMWMNSVLFADILRTKRLLQ